VTNAWRNDFVYDGKFRRRIERDYSWSGSAWVQTNEVRFIYDGNVVVQERDTNNTPTVTYTRGVGGLLARTDGNGSTFYHADGNGNITCLINANQVIVAKYLYDPFGTILSQSGPMADVNVYRFASKEWNGNAGFYYFGRRYYDPILHRFINRDPIAEFGGANLFAYCGNNAISFYDPLGLCWWQDLLDGLSLGWNLAQRLNPANTVQNSIDQDVALFKKYISSGYLSENGIFNTGVMVVGETAGTTPFAEGIYHVDIGYGTPLSGLDSGFRLVTGGVSMVGWTVGGGAVAGEFSGVAGDVPNLLYRGGSATPNNFTPRPLIDSTGLSTFDTLEAATPPGGKAQVIDVSKLKSLLAIPDAPPEGHVSITPEDAALLEEWAATRGTGQVHPLTQELLDARVSEVKRPK
jgi:RHS repeat-associated protein